MCKAIEAGGQRCPGRAATRLKNSKARKAIVEERYAKGDATANQLSKARVRNWQMLVEYASTVDGSEALRSQWAELDPESENAKVLQGALDDGAMLAQANRLVENQFRASQGKEPLGTEVPLTTTQREQIQRQAEEQAAAEAARSRDPLGLRGSGAFPPPLPPAFPPPPPAIIPPPPPAIIPPPPPATIPPPPPPAMAPATAPRDKAAEAQAAREAKAAERATQKEVAAESRRLSKEVAAEVSAVRKWIAESGSKKYTAPDHTWDGPARWRGDGAPSRQDNKVALGAGRERYGDAFERAHRRYAGEYSPAEILAACTRLDEQARLRISGGKPLQGWFGGYAHTNPSRIASARTEAFEAAFKGPEVEKFTKDYVAANIEGVLWRTRTNRPPAPSRVDAFRAKVRSRVIQAWMARRNRIALGAR